VVTSDARQLKTETLRPSDGSTKVLPGLAPAPAIMAAGRPGKTMMAG